VADYFRRSIFTRFFPAVTVRPSIVTKRSRPPSPAGLEFLAGLERGVGPLEDVALALNLCVRAGVRSVVSESWDNLRSSRVISIARFITIVSGFQAGKDSSRAFLGIIVIAVADRSGPASMCVSRQTRCSRIRGTSA